MSPATSRSGAVDPPVHVVKADGKNNARLAVPLTAFTAAQVRLAENRPPVEASDRKGHVELVVGAAGSRYIADVVGLPSKLEEWPPSFSGAAQWIAGAVPHSWRRIDIEQWEGRSLRVVRCGDLARSRGDSEPEVERRYRASAARSAASPKYREQDGMASDLLAHPESNRSASSTSPGAISRWPSSIFVPLQAIDGGSPALGRGACFESTAAARKCSCVVERSTALSPGGSASRPMTMRPSPDGWLRRSAELESYVYKGPPVNRSITFADEDIDRALGTSALVVASRSLTSALTSRRLLGRGTHNHAVYQLLLSRLPTA